MAVADSGGGVRLLPVPGGGGTSPQAPPGTGRARAVSLSNDALLVVGTDGTARSRSLAAPGVGTTLLRSFLGEIHTAALAPDGSEAVTVIGTGAVERWDLNATLLLELADTVPFRSIEERELDPYEGLLEHPDSGE